MDKDFSRAYRVKTAIENYKNLIFLIFLWQLKLWFVGINRNDFSSLSSSNLSNFNQSDKILASSLSNEENSLIASTIIYKLETLIVIMAKRVVFSKGNQKKFIKDLKGKSNLGWRELSKRLQINESTLSKSYGFELSSIPYEIFKKIVLLLN